MCAAQVNATLESERADAARMRRELQQAISVSASLEAQLEALLEQGAGAMDSEMAAQQQRKLEEVGRPIFFLLMLLLALLICPPAVPSAVLRVLASEWWHAGRWLARVCVAAACSSRLPRCQFAPGLQDRTHGLRCACCA